MPALELKLVDDQTRSTNTQLIQLRRQMLQYARSWPSGSSERNQRRRTAASLRRLFATRSGLTRTPFLSFGNVIAIKATGSEIGQ